jgi:S1-C subfamily serine protease
MRRSTFLSLLLALLLASSVEAASREIIPPRDTRAEATARLATLALPELAPVFDRTALEEVGRVRMTGEPVAGARDARLLHDGSVVALGEPLRLALAPSGFATESLSRVSGGKLVVEGAAAVRLRFAGVPAGTVLWIGGENEEPVRFEVSPGAEWGPTTNGELVYVLAENYEGAVEVTELASVAAVASQNAGCLQDVACTDAQSYPELEQASRAIAYIRFVRDGQSYVCSGGLVNDASGSGTPYLLTARHCIATQEQASSVEIVWDLKSDACGSNRMSPVARSYGADLLVASEATDVALLRLRSVPADRVFLGTDLRALKAGQPIHRVSHAAGLSQSYAAASVDGDGGAACLRAPRTKFIYSDPTAGAISPGSSGAPLLLPGLLVGGQLLGLCGADPTNPCATFNAVVDGSIRESWPVLVPYLDPSSIPSRRRAVR